MWSISDAVVFHTGLIIMLISLIAFAIYLSIWAIKAKRVNEQLDAEYGVKKKKTARKKNEAGDKT